MRSALIAALRVAAIVALSSAAPPALAADAPDSAAGTFRSQSMTMSAKSAIAFRGPSFVDKSEAILVAVSNAQLNADALVDYVDRRRVLEKRIKDASTGIVYFEFKPDGTYRGMSYYFAPGNGCGYCTGEVTSNTKLASDKLAGKLIDAEKERSFEITFATPIMTDDHGAPLPADGGAPGNAFLLYHAALAKGDRPALNAAMSQDQRQYWSDIERKGQLGSWLSAVAEAHPTKSVAITKGYATAERAVLLIEGESASGKVVGEVLLVKEGDAWRIDDEITEPARQ
jgi:hypothetical protein